MIRRSASEVLRSLETRIARLEERRVQNIRFRRLNGLSIDQVVMALGLSYQAEFHQSASDVAIRKDLINLIKSSKFGADAVMDTSISILVLDLVSETNRSYLLATLELNYEGKKLLVELPVMG